MLKSRRLPLASLLATGLVACSGPSETPSNGVTAPSASEAQPAGATATKLWNDGAQRPLDIQVAHPSGVVLQLSSLRSSPTQTTVGMRVINGRDREVDLNRFGRRNGFMLLDTGERLFLSPPVSNTRLTIPAGQTFEGELVFLGRLPDAQSAVLVLNENMATDNEHTTTPGFRIDIPLAAPAT